jgi:uncharacterized protein
MAKKVRDDDWMKQILAEEEVGHLALNDDGQPYVVPLNYAYLDDRVVIHCAVKGRKIDIVRKEPRCCFAVNRHPDRVKYHADKRCHYRYHSVLVTGRATYIESEEERLEWMLTFKDHFDSRMDWHYAPVPDIKSARRCGIIVIAVDSMSGRKEEGQDKKAHLAMDK